MKGILSPTGGFAASLLRFLSSLSHRYPMKCPEKYYSNKNWHVSLIQTHQSGIPCMSTREPCTTCVLICNLHFNITFVKLAPATNKTVLTLDCGQSGFLLKGLDDELQCVQLISIKSCQVQKFGINCQIYKIKNFVYLFSLGVVFNLRWNFASLHFHMFSFSCLCLDNRTWEHLTFENFCFFC